MESANKLVVEQRLKGSGMHWARLNVNPMVALRACTCRDQWEATWPTISTQLRDQDQARRHARRVQRRLAAQPVPEPPAAPPPLPAPPVEDPPTSEKLVVNGRPSQQHPWRRFRLPGSRDFSSDAKPCGAPVAYFVLDFM